MLNRIILSGRLTRDPELRRTQSGIPVASFSLAVNRDFKDKATGETPVDFIDIVAWRHTGEFAANYFAKGSMAMVDGRLQIRDWRATDAVPPRSWPATSTSGTPSRKRAPPPPPRTPMRPRRRQSLKVTWTANSRSDGKVTAL